jgi:hypothetical protein
MSAAIPLCALSASAVRILPSNTNPHLPRPRACASNS